jgi:hypothetical protein
MIVKHAKQAKALKINYSRCLWSVLRIRGLDNSNKKVKSVAYSFQGTTTPVN